MKHFNNYILGIVGFGALFALLAACGGAQTGGGAAGGPRTKAGAPVSEQTMESFAAAYRQYEQAQAGGLEEGECSALEGRFAKVSRQVEGGLPEALFNIGAIWRECGDHDKARDFFNQANAAAKLHSKNKMPGFAPALVHLGVYQYQSGNKSGARQLFDQAREADRRSEEAYTNLGILLREERDWAKAQLDLRRALAVNSDYMVAFAQMALLYLEVAEENRQMLDITELVCQQASARGRELKANPLHVAPIHNIWGLALIRKGDVVRAVEQFDQARRLNPDFFEAHMNFGAVNLSFRGYEAAADAFRQAIRLHPEDYEAHLSLGSALRGLEQYDAARGQYEKARGIDAARPQAYYNLAVLMQDYELSAQPDMGAQIKLLGNAKNVYRDFLQKCQTKRAECIRRRPGMEDQDMTEAARSRIKACDETINGLREAQKLAAEAERMEREAAAQTKKQGGGGGGE